VTAESERWRDVHVMLGYTTLALIAFRVAWGFIGTRYARFASFAFGPSRVVSYLRSLATRTPHHYTGHNPAGSWAIYALLAGVFAAGATGLAVYNDMGGRWLEHLHEFVANAVLAVVAIHVVGVFAGSLLHRENLVGSMVTGRKTGPARDGIGTPRRVVAALLLTLVIGLWTGMVPTPGLTTAMTPVKVTVKSSAYTGKYR
jgi:cytochrome b